jgi:uncharacterized protein
MLFEWNDRKAAQNVAKHGVLFEYAVRVFLDPHRLDSEDTRRDYGEERWLSLGRIEERLFAIAYTRRGKVIRVISARKANEREQRKYDETLST